MVVGGTLSSPQQLHTYRVNCASEWQWQWSPVDSREYCRPREPTPPVGWVKAVLLLLLLWLRFRLGLLLKLLVWEWLWEWDPGRWECLSG